MSNLKILSLGLQTLEPRVGDTSTRTYISRLDLNIPPSGGGECYKAWFRWVIG